MTRYIQFNTEGGAVVTAPIDKLTLYYPAESQNMLACKAGIVGDSVYNVSRGEFDKILAVLMANDIDIHSTADVGKAYTK